ncbi:rod shape-determining protein RodA [Rhodobacter sphaeroides]|jgi:rod shape determining protein RodA|uniref:Peptidoglycan glycosyltransferase MrdB n=2 Tax=Cereibacter sphaeroides TaxID=1063 RepID=Q3J405_CERS4|nr:rod shape-determining protein RodA [Cereibacter sphaeroides]ABN76110.1 rod shape-determining protein RodA [Cereibacter sphaeroides ATCC 17029]ABA78479.1 cell elongation-specific peptidoglycan biosynthesis regulator RodA [Cereibacter sphaeroides 2.4.1]ACM00507.1 Rod shape-determining protein RodA [Cereibacter sphaeroides KD131]AMJ46831.1 rod shape-determining protein RodA [Cereibacter sphaeroides]ANS33544.1 rod shape-determining protein RodA [Cereibacter sphaeroides]
MSFLEYRVKTAPTGLAKVLHINWALVLLVTATASVGWLMLTSVAGGDIDTWAGPQMKRFAVGLVLMFSVAFVPIWFWRNMAGLAYIVSLALLVVVEFFGTVGMGAQRWIALGPVVLQPSEMAKVTLVMMLAAYYDWLDPKKVSRPLWVLLPVLIILVPTALVVIQPNLGTALLLLMVGAAVMFLAGVSLWYFGVVAAMGVGAVFSVFSLRGTPWQFLHDYQYRRIDTFFDPTADPLGAGYNIIQAKIALGSGGWAGKGFMQGTQSRLNFLPEKHTDFIFNTLAEEFGFVGAASLLVLYALVIAFCVASAMQNRDRFSSLLILGIAANFFFYLAVNLSMVMGMAPVVGVPLPLVSYGGSAMLVLMVAFGLVQSAHVHRLR